MTEGFRKGMKVKWQGCFGWVRGRIAELLAESRHETAAENGRRESAYLVEHENGGRVLKVHSELKQDG